MGTVGRASLAGTNQASEGFTYRARSSRIIRLNGTSRNNNNTINQRHQLEQHQQRSNMTNNNYQHNNNPPAAHQPARHPTHSSTHTSTCPPHSHTGKTLKKSAYLSINPACRPSTCLWFLSKFVNTIPRDLESLIDVWYARGWYAWY